ncbi:class I SAM-dependent methyltransferase [Pseudoramibacter faecis]|uniref:class I SAM-dependent methyltransferase n=1 Tax=Pseudoramibacter faecis TaxID=3108534 RepID=UPI002E771292|nr:class I SAM-dependent methyltransferase [Pseudoramibacter sp. HA2172]
MIAIAQEKALPNTQFVVGDSEDLPFRTPSFDAVICANSFHHYPNPQRFFDGFIGCCEAAAALFCGIIPRQGPCFG